MNEKQQNEYAGIDGLIQEIMCGEHKKDILPNASLKFSEERQAQYFSNLRKNLQSDLAMRIMSHSPQLFELNLLKKWENQ